MPHRWLYSRFWAQLGISSNHSADIRLNTHLAFRNDCRNSRGQTQGHSPWGASKWGALSDFFIDFYVKSERGESCKPQNISKPFRHDFHFEKRLWSHFNDIYYLNFYSNRHVETGRSMEPLKSAYFVQKRETHIVWRRNGVYTAVRWIERPRWCCNQLRWAQNTLLGEECHDCTTNHLRNRTISLSIQGWHRDRKR